MSTVRFIADLHLSHANMSKKRGFETIEEHDEYIIKQWNSVVRKRDTTYILGDVTMEKSAPYHLLSRLKGIKNVVLGNHDHRQDVKKLLEYVNSVSGMLSYKKVILTHCPVHPMEMDYRFSHNIHGHIHEKQVLYNGLSDLRYICVSCERVDFIPKTLIELGIV